MDYKHDLYDKFIQRIINMRGQWAIPEVGVKYPGVWENHHIVPVCMGGLPTIYKHDTIHENMIGLAPEEHYEAHRLLAEENPTNNKLVFAFWSLSVRKQPNGTSYIQSAEEYAEARQWLKEMYANYNRSDEFKQKVSNGMRKMLTEVGFSIEHLEHISTSLKKRAKRMHEFGLNTYGDPIRKYGECGSSQHCASRSLAVGCIYRGTKYIFKSIREAGIWGFNSYKPLGDKYIECTLQRKIKAMCNGKITTYGHGRNKIILNDKIEGFGVGGDTNE